MNTKSKHMMSLLILNVILCGTVLVLVRANSDNNSLKETSKMNETVGYLACKRDNGEFEIKQLFEKETATTLFKGVFSGNFTEIMEQYPGYRSYLNKCCEIALSVKSDLMDSNENQLNETAWKKKFNQSYDILSCIDENDSIRFQKMDKTQDEIFVCKIFPNEKNKQDIMNSLLYVVSFSIKINNSVCPEFNLRKIDVFAYIANLTAVGSNGNRNRRAIGELPAEDIYIPIGGLKNHHRHLRHIDTCSFPTALETAAISCRIYPSSIKCIQQCAFGYTLEDGIQQKMECKFSENKWVPKGFKECRPFVDCTLSLISGGFSKCSSMSLTRGTECRVECLHYEDKPAVPETTYTCDIEGKWDPSLPFCVIPQSGLALVKAPEIQLHDDYYE